MSQYKCETILATRVLPGRDGLVQPMCTSCVSSDCTHRIQIVQMSILGIMCKHRLLKRGNNAYYVIGCQGYSMKQNIIQTPVIAEVIIPDINIGVEVIQGKQQQKLNDITNKTMSISSVKTQQKQIPKKKTRTRKSKHVK